MPASDQIANALTAAELKRRRAARAGDLAAFTRIAEDLLPRAWRVAAAILADDRRAGEAVVHAVAGAWRSLPSLGRVEDFDAWFLRVLVHECGMQLRNGLQPAGTSGDRDREVVGRLVFPAATALAPAGPLDRLDAEFERLGGDDRALVVLRDLERRPIEEIAACLHLPLDTAEWRLQDARLALRAALPREAVGDDSPPDALIAAMFERRVGVQPAWLVDRTMHAVARTAQVRPRLGLAARGLAGAAIVVVAVGLGGVLIAGGRLWGAASGGATPDPAIVATDAPASSADTTPTASDDAATTAAPHETVATNPMTGAPLRPDSIAVVTREGTRLRVRSAPGTGGDSALLEPVLGSGTRMLVLAGPVRASKLDWYQVHVPDVELSGWVAAGRDGIAWIKASQPACPPRLDAAALYDTPPIDLLVCTAANPFSLVIDDIMVLDQDGPCPYAVTDRTCRLDPAWLGPTVALLLGGRDAGDGEMGMAMSLPAAVEPRLTAGGSAPGDTGRARVTLRLDHPAARSCRALGADGAPVEEPWITAVRCRLRLVLEGVEPPPVP